MNTQAKQRKLLGRFKALSRVMSRESGIEVYINGNTAYTDFDKIVLPAGNLDDPDYLELLEGAIDHEVGHIKNTCTEYTRKAFHRGQLFKSLHNAIEDVRMESVVVSDYPGAKRNIERLVVQAIKRGWFCIPSSESSSKLLLQAYVLYYLRYRHGGSVCLKEHIEATRQLFIGKTSAELAAKLEAILDTFSQLKSNADSYALADEVLKLMEENDSDDDSQADSDDDADSDSDDDSQANSEDDADSDSDDDSQANSDVGGDKASGTDTFIKELQNDVFDEEIGDLHELVRDELEDQADDCTEEQVLDCRLPEFVQQSGQGQYNLKPALRMSGKIRQELHRVIIDKNIDKRIYSRAGSSIDANRLAGIKAGNLNVFKTETITRAPNAAVSLVVDRSISMDSYGRMEIANLCAFSMATALQKLPNTKSDVIYYAASGTFHVAKSFNEKQCIEKRFQVSPHGGTMTGGAVHAALLRLAVRPEQKKLMFIITDGETHDYEYLRTKIADARLLGITVVGIGISTGTLDGFEECDFFHVRTATELPKALKDAVKRKMIA